MMKIGFLVNDLKQEKVGFTTVRLACEAINMGHEAFYFGVGDLAYDSDESIGARARTFTAKKYAHTPPSSRISKEARGPTPGSG